jgi:flagellar P-ring protein precursor FlgI
MMKFGARTVLGIWMIWGCFLSGSFIPEAHAVRIKDMASIKGIRTNQLVGYGLIVGLDGTGDKAGATFTIQSMANMLERMGIQVNKSQLKVKNVAAVMVTASMPPFARIGSKIDVVASSIGDAKSLGGGTLLLTPLRGVDGNVYALAQGAIALGGVGAGGAGGGTTKNHLQVARIANGATVEREIPVRLDGKTTLTLSLYNPDFTTVQRISKVIDDTMGAKITHIIDSGAISLNIPETFQNQVPQFIARIETLAVDPDTPAKIIVNEKTGTVVIGENVKISTVAVAHGNLTVSVRAGQEVSQPGPFAEGETVATPQTDVNIEEEANKVIVVPENATIGDLVRALNAIGVTPRDLISIFHSIKAAGALQADLEII